MLKRYSWLNSLVMVVGLAACVTVNTYFPDAAVEKAADRIIEEVWGKEVAISTVRLMSLATVYQLSASSLQGRERKAGDFFVRPAAAVELELSAASPDMEVIIASMGRRYHHILRPHFQDGVVGLTHDGFIAIRDIQLVSLKEGVWLDKVIVAENTDRKALYRQFARANGHPEWERQIQQIFARRWIKKAPLGWWYQNAQGYWERKE
jgi:uncharacterized protein